jgi:hypothetical protein
MASIIRTAKSGGDWSTNELRAYNIVVRRQDATHFFGREPGSIDHLDPNLLSPDDPSTATHLSKETYRFLAYLDLASRSNSGQESAIDDFAKSALEVTGFDELGTVLRTRYDIPFTICGDPHRAARTDVCLVHLNSMILLVVQEGGTARNGSDPEPQVIAEAIASFQHNNRKRAESNHPVLDRMTIPCITMIGTKPTFYKVPVTAQLSESVVSSQYPLEQTVVTRCSPPTRCRASEGMEIPDYRRNALQYYDTFRDLAKVCWAEFIDGYGTVCFLL